MIALVPALIGVEAGRTLADALGNGYRLAMIILAACCVVAAVVSGIFVQDTRTAGPRFAPPAPFHGCALPDVAIQGRALSRTRRARPGDAS
jgi:hypothetical protein